MDQDFHKLCQIFLENGTEYNQLLASLREQDNLTRDEFLAFQRKIAESGNYAYTSAEPLFKRYLTDIFKDPLRLTPDDVKELIRFGEECVKAGDELLAIEIYKAVIKAAEHHGNVLLTLTATSWYAKLCQMKRHLSHTVVPEINRFFNNVDYSDSRFKKTDRFNYTLLLLYKANAVLENSESGYLDILSALNQAESFINERIKSGDTEFDWQALYLPELHNIAAATATLCEFNSGRSSVISPNLANAINDIISSSQETLFDKSMAASADIMNRFAQDGIQAFRFVGWAETAYYGDKGLLPSKSEYFDLLFSIAEKIMETPDATAFSNQAFRMHALIHACGIVSKHFDDLADEKARLRCHNLTDATLAMINRQPKMILTLIGSLREELFHIAKTSSLKMSRRDFVKLMLKTTGHTHIPTYAHSLAVARLNKITTEFILKKEPDLLAPLLVYFDSPEHLVSEMELAGFAHDLGKLEINNGPISQNSRPLTDAEYFIMIQAHPAIGAHYLVGGELEFQRACALFHHTFHRGSGVRSYPQSYDKADEPLLNKYKLAIDITHDSDVRHAIADNLGRAYTVPRTAEDSQRICINDAYERGGAVMPTPAAAEILKTDEKLKRDITWTEYGVAELSNFVSVENILKNYPDLEGQIMRVKPGIVELSPVLAELTEKYPELQEMHRQVLNEYNKDAYYEAYCELVKR